MNRNNGPSGRSGSTLNAGGNPRYRRRRTSDAGKVHPDYRHRLHAPVHRARPRRGARDRRAARGLRCRHHLLDTADAYCWDATEAGHNERLIARALADLARRPLAHPRGDQGRSHAAGRAVGRRTAGRATCAPRARPAGARSASTASISTSSMRPIRERRSRPASARSLAEARRPDRGDRALQRHRRTDRGSQAHRRDRRGAGRAEPLARRQRPQRRGRVLRRERHPAARLPAARRAAAPAPHARRSGAGDRRGAPRRDAVRDRAGLAARPVGARSCRSPDRRASRPCSRSPARTRSS